MCVKQRKKTKTRKVAWRERERENKDVCEAERGCSNIPDSRAEAVTQLPVLVNNSPVVKIM